MLACAWNPSAPELIAQLPLTTMQTKHDNGQTTAGRFLAGKKRKISWRPSRGLKTGPGRQATNEIWPLTASGWWFDNSGWPITADNWPPVLLIKKKKTKCGVLNESPARRRRKHTTFKRSTAYTGQHHTAQHSKVKMHAHYSPLFKVLRLWTVNDLTLKFHHIVFSRTQS